MKNWQKDAQPEWPPEAEAGSGARDLSEAGRHADATEVLPAARAFPPAGGSPVSAREPRGADGYTGPDSAPATTPSTPYAPPAPSVGSGGFAGSASGPGWFGESGDSPHAGAGPAADRTQIPGARIGGHRRRVAGPDPSAPGRITWGTTSPSGTNPGNAAPHHAPDAAAPRAAAFDRAPYAPASGPAHGTHSDPDRTDVLPSAGPTRAFPAASPVTGPAAPRAAAFDRAPYAAPASGSVQGVHSDPDRTDVLPSAGPTRGFPAASPSPATAPPPGPATAVLRDPWQELPDAEGEEGAGAGAADHTHDPHEVTVQLDAVQLGEGQLLRAERGHRKSRAEPSEGPVFVDASGRRSRLYRRLGILVGIACAVYAVVIVSTLLSGNSDAPWMPVPGQEEGAPAGQVDTTPLPSQPAQPSGTGGTAPQTSPSAGTGTATEPGGEAPASGGSGVVDGTARQPGTSSGPQSSASGAGGNPGGSGVTGPDPAQSTQASTPPVTDPSTPAGGGDTPAEPTGPTGGPSTGTDPGEGGTNPNGAGGPDPVAGPAGAPVVVAGPAGTAASSSSDSSASLSLSPENTL